MSSGRPPGPLDLGTMSAPRSFRAGLSGLLLVPWLACMGAPSGGTGGSSVPDPPAPARPAVAISEIMYHPVLENDLVEAHEFIELHNAAEFGADLAGWKLRIGGHDAFTFAADTSLGAGAYLVVAKDRAKLSTIYGLGPSLLVGDYAGQLDNGGDVVELVDGQGALVDVVRYDDRFPWPVGADALGASAAWLPAGVHDKEQYKGRSLERLSFAVPATLASNWDASALGGGTPGKANSATGAPLAMVTEVGPRGVAVAAGQIVPIVVTFSQGQITQPAIEYFIDDVARPDAGKSPQRLELTLAAGKYSANLPPLPARAIVRYRVLGKRLGPTSDVISPRPSDPYGYHTIFAEVEPAAPAGAYQVFIAPANWTQMWTNLGGGPNAGCELNPSWDARVPAVVVRNGQVQDVQVRYQGSRYQRRNGLGLPAWPAGTGPTAPADFKALSWRLSYPAFDRWTQGKEQRQTVNLNKQNQACPGVLNHLSSKLQWAAGVRTQRMRFERLYVNGRYYHYMMEVENVDEDLLGKSEPSKEIGDLFKSDGAVDDNQGPWGRGNFRPLQLNPSCARWTKLDRYRSTYERQSHEWKDASPAGHEELIAIIEALAPMVAAANGGGSWQPVRDHLSKYFDVAQMMSHWAVRNFAGVWDDGVHNFYLYKRTGDGKYEVLPQDFDLEYGGDGGGFSKAPTSSIYMGEEGAGVDPVGGSNALKSALIKAFRAEFRARLGELLKGVLSESNVMARLAEAQADWDQQAWDESPALGKCDVAARIEAARTWLAARYAFLAQQGLM
jgi:spore coat protein CotH